MLATPNSKKIEHLKSFESAAGKESFRVVLYTDGVRFGVATLYKTAAVCIDYQNPSKEELRTLPGNEASIIDWVDAETAERRYNELLNAALKVDKVAPATPLRKPGPPNLQLVRTT